MFQHRPLQYVLSRFNKLSQANKRQKSFRKNKKKRRDVERIFHITGQGTPSISVDCKRTKPKTKPMEYKYAAQARDYANMTKSTKPETNWTASTLPHCIVIPSTKTAAIFNETNNNSDRHMPALLPR
jgi:hypothetical protein